MTHSFSLLDDPWIPCLDLEGNRREVGLRTALADAHRLRAVECPSPLETAAILRLMLAVLHRVFSSETPSEWSRRWRAGCWDAADLDAYFERWKDRFDLFHPLHPFLQQRDDRLPPRTIVNLIPGAASSQWFNHQVETNMTLLTPAEAARVLLAVQAFGTPGIRHPQLNLYFSGAPWLVGMVFFVAGNTLFETQALNWLQYSSGHPRPNLEKTPDDCPNWERDDPFTPEREVPLGYLDYLSWPNRRIFLLPEDGPDGVRVREVIDAPGLKLRAELQDPFKHYESSKKGLSVMFLNPAKALWRNSHTLLGIHGEGRKPVQALSWLSNLALEGVVPEHTRYQLYAVGTVSDQAKVDFTRMEWMSFPVHLLQQDEKVGVIKELIEKAEEVRKSLRDALDRLAEQLIAMQANLPDSRKLEKYVNGLITHWNVEPLYWQSLEQTFLRLLDDLANGAGENSIRTNWQKTLQQNVWAALEAAVTQAGESPQALKAAVLARNQLAAGWKKIYPDQLD
mgnify:CR=1 FL=1